MVWMFLALLIVSYGIVAHELDCAPEYDMSTEYDRSAKYDRRAE